MGIFLLTNRRDYVSIFLEMLKCNLDINNEY